MSSLEELLALQFRADGLIPAREHRFHPIRKWRFDFAFPERRLGIECEGGTWSGGRHTRGSGYAKDLEKYNAATLLGWRVLRFTSEMIKSGLALRQINEAIHSERVEG